MNGALILSILEDISSYPVLKLKLVEVGFVKLRLRYNNGSEGQLLSKGLLIRFSATEKKKELKALTIVTGLLVG